MIKRIILFLAVALSLVWITYYALDILDDKNNYQPEALFGTQDESLLIIIRPSEAKISAVPDFDQSPVYQLVTSLNDSLFETAYISKKRDHFLLSRAGVWNEAIISKLFSNSNDIAFENESFKIKGYKGRYHKTNLYLFKGELETATTTDKFIFDSKASAAIINFDANIGIASHSDIYFKESGLINYVTRNDEIQEGKKVSDEALFSGVTSRNIDSYHFSERTYKASKDSTFKNSPMFLWMQFGFIEVTHKGKRALITDYIEGQDPILVLNELNNSYDTSWFTNPLLSDFPKKGNKYKVEYMEDFVVISSDEGFCKKLISDYKLGNTIALNENARNKHYGSLPKNVSERIITEEQSFSRSAYKGKLLESYTNQIATTNESISEETISISIGGDIRDFYALEGNGNVIALTKEGSLKRFTDQELAWTNAITGKTKGSIQIIDLHANGEKHILFNTDDEIHLVQMNGSYATGFPVKLESEMSTEVKFYRWKGKSYFLVGTENGETIHFDSKGRELNIFKTAITATEEIQVWASQQRLFSGFSNGATFVMYDMEKNRVHREFLLPFNSKALKIPNEILHFGVDNNNVVKTDQKGNQSTLGNYNSTKILETETEGTPIIAIQSNNEIHLLNVEGIPFGEIRLPFNEVEDIFVHNTNSGKTVVGVIDGLENNVYLYETDGQLITKKGLEGQKKLFVHSSNKGYRITTIVDQFIVQYFEN